MTDAERLREIADKSEGACHAGIHVGDCPCKWADAIRTIADRLEKLQELLHECENYFGPCWCKKEIGYKCPQCQWRAKLETTKEAERE